MARRRSVNSRNQSTDNCMDDRFDRRELLLHLGDMLDAVSRLTSAGALDTPVTQRVQGDTSWRELPFLSTLAAQITVAGFGTQVARAFAQWPRELLEPALNRDALARAVQLELFDGNPAGWNAYVAYVQKHVAWFGAGLSEVLEGSEPAEKAATAVAKAAGVTATTTAPTAGGDGEPSNQKRGWPWPEPRSTS
jgi:hypothetical protein